LTTWGFGFYDAGLDWPESKDQASFLDYKGLSMAVPRRRTSNSRTGKRRSHDHVKPRQLGYCPQCSTSVPTHNICPKCGYYQGRTLVEIKEE
jgi:large subunit ribosomal protein L32